MAGAMVSASTGLMISVIAKLTTLLGEEYRLVKGVKRGIRFLRDELSSMNAVLQRLVDMEDDQIDVQTKEWRNKVRELSYDIEDCIDRFMLRHSCHGDAKASFVHKTVHKMKMLWEDRQITKEIQELKLLINEESERRKRYHIDQSLTPLPQPVVLDPWAPALFDEATNLVGIDCPREEIIEWLKGEEKKLKAVFIFGAGGLGKTTLAIEVYGNIEESFDCCASVSVSRNPNIKKVLRDILFQVNKNKYASSERWETEQIIRMLGEYLTNKRYLIVIDDIWGILAWEHVKSALPDNNNRSRIIATTRIKGVAKSCCTSIAGQIYEANPLSEDDSRRLFFSRMLCSNGDCPGELTELANDILRKCGGLPLAIISITGLLTNRSPTVEAWVKIQKSISSAVEKDSPIERMKRILFLSYYDLPHHLKTCLLYMSVFPEDYSISTKHLIWSWVAEGLIPGNSREIMEQLGESYLNELINRSMIQPAKIGVNGTIVKFCRVHDIILDFIISQAAADNFVNILNGNDAFRNSSNKIRRLSLQSKFFEVTEMSTTVVNVSHLRSVNMFGHDHAKLDKHVPWYLKSQFLQVLNIESTWNYDAYYMEHIRRFPQLKYLRITGARIRKLPEQIGNLQHLEILDVRECSFVGKLPSGIVQLRNLVHLFVPVVCRLPDGIGNLKALEELSVISLVSASAKFIQELGDLTKLRDLRVCFDYCAVICDEIYKKVCISSLSKLVACGLRSLHIEGASRGDSDFINCVMVSHGSTPPLSRLALHLFPFSTTIPSRIGSLVNLNRLRIEVIGQVDEEGLKMLASLPILHSLSVLVAVADDEDALHPRHVIGRLGFQRLVKFNFCCIHEAALKFEAGAMPKLQRLKLTLKARCQFKYGQSGLILGLQNLSALKHITVNVNCRAAAVEEVEALEDDIKGVAGAIPDNPILEVKRKNTHCMRWMDGQAT